MEVHRAMLLVGVELVLLVAVVVAGGNVFSIWSVLLLTWTVQGIGRSLVMVCNMSSSSVSKSNSSSCSSCRSRQGRRMIRRHSTAATQHGAVHHK